MDFNIIAIDIFETLTVEYNMCICACSFILINRRFIISRQYDIKYIHTKSMYIGIDV